MKIAIGQINPRVGDIKENTKKIIDFIKKASQKKAKIIVFPELSIIGYPPRDLLLKPSLIEENKKALMKIAKESKNIISIVGYAETNPSQTGKSLLNCAACCKDGKIIAKYAKNLLPTYNVFDETRYFEAGTTTQSILIDDIPIGITICEDLWTPAAIFNRNLYPRNPIEELAYAGIKIIINLSASPFVINKHQERISLITTQAKKYKISIVYVNQVGANDELVFDGNSCIFDENGECIAHAKDFEEDLVIAEINCKKRISIQIPDKIESVYKALTLGLRDYVKKSGFEKVVLGLSGGIDSAVVCCLAAEAVGPKNVYAISMPSRFSSKESIEDARKLVKNLGVRWSIVPINEVHEAFEGLLNPYFKNLKPDETEENIQARIRGIIIMAFSNKFGYLPLATGNKSEFAVGYCTLYGDTVGALAVIGDVFKTMVYKLALYINRYKEIIPLNIIKKPPSAELRPHQKDQDSLPPYEILDTIVYKYVEEHKSIEEIIREGISPEIVKKVINLIEKSEYKRRQAPPVLKITGKAFGVDTRIPIVKRITQL